MRSDTSRPGPILRAMVFTLSIGLWLSSPAAAQLERSAQTPSSTPALLDVSYLSHTPDLCGGAALAVVLRYCFVPDDWDGASAAWNRRRQSRIDAITVTGATHTDHPVVVRITGLEPRQLLTPEALARATRRLNELPAAAGTSLSCTPGRDGTVAVAAMVREHDVWPTGLVDWATIGARALLKDELVIDVAGPTGAGEVWTGSWRWASNRPRVGFELAIPAPHTLRGIVSLEALWERQAYAASVVPGSDVDLFRVERWRGGIAVSDWMTGRLRWSAGAALDAFGRDRFVATHGGVDVRLAGDRLALLVDGALWAPIGGTPRFHRVSFLTTWLLAPAGPSSWMASAGVAAASRRAPLAVWPAGDTATHREALLRAHPLHDDGVVTGTVFGRHVAHASGEYHRSIYQGKPGHAMLVGFVDSARAWQRAAPPDTPGWHVDVGLGFRFAASPTGGALRLDVGYGLRDGNLAMSAGWVSRWPRR